jgi:hypothetical protein
MSSMTRYPFIVAAVAGALMLGACGSAKDSSSAGAGVSDQDKAFDGALKFAKCMREHGVDMPDPKRVGTGGISISGSPGGPGIRPDDPKMKTAQKVCGKYMELGGGGPKLDPASQARMQDAFFAYARCMRGKGIDMPDPKVGKNGVQMTMKAGAPGSGKAEAGTGGGMPSDSPVFRAADKDCHHFLAQVERHGQGSGPVTETAHP